jgi:hypothetical protein
MLELGLGRLHKSDGGVRRRGSRPVSVTAVTGRTHPPLGDAARGGTKVPSRRPAEPFGKCIRGMTADPSEE